MSRQGKRKFKYTDYVLTAIKAAKMSIEMFNRVDVEYKDNAAIIFSAQSWEFISKALLIKHNGLESILLRGGRSITGENAVNKTCHELGQINKDETAIVQQIMSLRNEAMHGILPNVPAEIITHLLYYSLKSFRAVLKNNFSSYFRSDFNQNFLSISFNNHTFYSDKVGKLFSNSRKYNTENNRLLYLLDRGVDYSAKPSAIKMQELDTWQNRIKKLPRKSRVAMHLPIYKHMNDVEDVRFVPVEVRRGYKAEVNITKTKNKNEATSVIIKKTDPNIDYPHRTIELADKLGKNQNFVAVMSRKLDIRKNSDYCYVIRTSKSGEVPKYSDAALTYMKNYLDTHPDYNPYR